MQQNQSALIIIYEGFEEMEAIGPIDLLRRAGIDCTVASREDDLLVCGRSGIFVRAEISLDKVVNIKYDLVVVPGGPGYERMVKDSRVIELLKKQASGEGLIGAICAAPTVLKQAGLLEGRRYTAHSGVAGTLPGLIADQAVIEDGNIITSRGAGTATEFALALVARLAGLDKAREIATSICYRPGESG